MRAMLVLGTALALASPLAGAQGMMMGQGQGMMNHGMMGEGMMGPGQGMMSALNLTAEQQQTVLAIQEEHRKKNWAAMGEVRAEQYKLRSLYGAEPIDANKVAQQQKKVDELRRALLKSRVETHNQVLAVLTPEQRKLMRRHGPWWGEAGE